MLGVKVTAQPLWTAYPTEAIAAVLAARAQRAGSNWRRGQQEGGWRTRHSPMGSLAVSQSASCLVPLWGHFALSEDQASTLETASVRTTKKKGRQRRPFALQLSEWITYPRQSWYDHSLRSCSLPPR